MQYLAFYKNLIWTNHVLERLQERKIPQEWAWRAFQYPDKITPEKSNGSIEYQKRYEHVTVTLIAKKNERKEWIIVSCWVDPPLPGSTDIQKKKEYWRNRKEPLLFRIIGSLYSLFFRKK